MKAIRKESLVIAAIVFAVLWLGTAVLYLLLVRPQSVQTEQVKSRLDAKQSELDSLSTEALQKAAAQAAQCRSGLSEYVLLADQQGDLPVRLRKLSDDSRLTEFVNNDTTSSNQYQNTEVTTLAERRMRITFVGDFTGFAGFLYAVESNHPVVFVDSFSVTHSDKDNMQVSVNMDAAVLYEVTDNKRI